MSAASVPRQLLNRQVPVRSGTRTSSRANAVSVGHHRATTGASSRRGPTERTVSCSSALVESPDGTQSSGGNPPNGPGQHKPTGGAGGPEDRGPAPGWLQAAFQAGWAQPFVSFVVVAWLFLNGGAAFIDAVCNGISNWHASLATKADVTDAKNEVKDLVNEVKDIVNKRMGAMEESLKFVVTWPSLLSYVGIVVVGIAGGAFGTWMFIGKKKPST